MLGTHHFLNVKIRNSHSIMNDKTRVNILGTCICRDIFGMQLEDGGYKIKRFIQDISPISIGISNSFSFPLAKVEQIIGEKIKSGNFLKRNLILDLIGRDNRMPKSGRV